LEDAVDAHGQEPYDWDGLVASLKRLKESTIKATPLGWPVSFLKNARELDRDEAESRVQAWLRDADIAAWYLPFGWFLIAALRHLQTPPYGHRGLDADETRDQEGTYRWSLTDAPLPPRPQTDDDA